MKSEISNNPLSSLSNTDRMPVLFLGHGSPMNAIEENEFVAAFRQLGKELAKPYAILCVSAHWETKGTFVTAMQNPRTIHDFGGFPKALYEVQYATSGNPELASAIKQLITKTDVGLDMEWGLDHGTWSVVKHLFPNADVPVLQLSIDYSKPAQFHYELAKELSILRSKGILIIGSGNMVHNLGLVAWNKLEEKSYAYDWATEANNKMKAYILNNDYQKLIEYQLQGESFKLSIPTPEHYLPLIYAQALKEEDEQITLFNDKIVGGSLSMTSLKIMPNLLA
ncbi:MAG: 4,5-DOPA dioxygenase extradiol [Bacteroidetes bacterium HGW-Bacteroidetes-6]|nr:MAG: 4,5-DOPA dioxygenase extradiol [Bacteroidetes bacterium HGW-Bacteroidetes-6]